ncbi:MAG: hypothetical protein WC971_04985 [Coriobacteriia bacterium]
MRKVRPSLPASLAIAALIVLALALSGCARAAATGAPGPQVAPPTVKLLEPPAGAEVPAGEVAVAVETSGLKFVMPSNTVVPGEGHVHFTLDDEPFEMSTSPEYVLKDVAPGSHRLKAELVQNDTKPFDPPVKQEIEFTAK